MRHPIQIQKDFTLQDNFAALSLLRILKKGSYLFHQFERATHYYCLKEGLMAIGCFGDDGTENFTYFVGPGDYFGQEAISGGNRNSFALVLSQTAEIAVFDARNWTDQSQRLRPLNDNWSKLLQRAQSTMIRNTAMNLADRIKKTLVEIGSLIGVRLLSGEILIRTKLKHREIAMLCCASRQSITTQLNELIKAGYFIIDGNSILLREKLINNQ